MLIQMLLLITVGIFSIVDHLQTVALINCGYTEANPIVLWIIGNEMNWNDLLIVKVSLIVLCGTLLIINYYKKRRNLA